MSTRTLPRKITIYLSAPPGEGISAARDYFREYVKPVLVASAVDYEVIEGRRGGEIRNAVGESVRKWRRSRGEAGRPAPGDESEEGTVEEALKQLSDIYGLKREMQDEESGVMVVGRHTWKEFIRGVHEGWLGPADSQVEQPPPAPPAEAGKPSKATLKVQVPPPILKLEEYHEKPLPPTFPTDTASLPLVSPVAVVPFPHILGFLNTPIRIYRYLTQRHLADRVGRETAAICLGFSRPFHAFIPAPLPADGKAVIDDNVLRSVDGKENDGDGGHGGEIDVGCHPEEERNWDKQYRELPSEEDLAPLTKKQAKEGEEADDKEVKVEELSENQRYKLAAKRDAREWAAPIVVDGRIAGRLRRYDLAVVTPEVEFHLQ